ncbi:hypothetical protein NEUTE1DRAFT_101239 [Neurospora tetrasperma FGSC 2508]|uniref:Uncharacterized protein n=1 Tax=Neurospora tetrasperma (strain FGSC 2508 / ATCC MYA-4615 / P0657) TaxID=510951 RepID=F8MLB7_NEUT8|nr:uncharacterized protein NEUTE1DRAFT_101239 [Neurospora tetrasperma FGSC 2508]EGO58390.1 hypothetical protein NEUTE1DRAFT_101239 [Neurospora tetrasperma FGSC 2508]EGZ71281.1 hypothetical protein NEUTE2DRAFT_138513 [Neurospora tetrasperma FGSC 2509]
MADESHHSFFEEAFFANRSREEPFELLYGDDDNNTNLIDHFGPDHEWGVDEDDHASIQGNSESEPVVDPILPQEDGPGAIENSSFSCPEDVSDIAHNAATQHLVYTPSIRNIPNASPESGADSQDNNLITRDDSGSFMDGASMGLDNPLSVHVPPTNINSNHALETAADLPEPVLASAAHHSHEAKKSQQSLEESNLISKASSSAPFDPSTVAPPSVEVVCQRLASLDINDGSDRPAASESSTTSVPACFRLPIRPSGRCSVIRTINGFRLHCPCPV